MAVRVGLARQTAALQFGNQTVAHLDDVASVEVTVEEQKAIAACETICWNSKRQEPLDKSPFTAHRFCIRLTLNLKVIGSNLVGYYPSNKSN